MKLPNVEDIYPLYPMQQGMLFHSLDEIGTGVYFIQLGCRMQGGIDPVAFRRAWEQVVQRHAILRTAFVWQGVDQPMQVVRQQVDLPWCEEDWRDLSEAEQGEKWQRFLREDQRQGFDFHQAPLLRLALIRTGEHTHYFAWSTHHMLMDGWCSQILTGEVFALYQAYREGRQLELPRPPAYRDYIAWLQKQDEEKAENFWREELKGFTTPTRLGIEQDKSGELEDVTETYSKVSEQLSPELTGKLEELARNQRVTLNTILQGAWALLLSRYSGVGDVVFGAAVSGRSAEVPGIESMVGLFINTLPVRAQVNDSETVATYLKRLQVRQAQAREYEGTPVVKVLEWSDVRRGTPLFDTLVVFENYPVDEAIEQQVAEIANIDELRLLDLNNFPITLSASPGKKFLLKLTYSRRIFDRGTMEIMLGHLRTGLDEMAARPERQIGEISLLTHAERQQVLTAWNSTGRVDLARGKWLPELFEEQAERTPHAISVDHEGEVLTYSELNRRANQLAHYLRALGVGPEVRVGICLERSVDVLVAVIGVLKAGGAYVPLDPEYPAERIAYMLDDAQVPIVLVRESVRERLDSAAPFWTQVISMDGDRAVIGAACDSNPEKEIGPENLAYVIYTSGSTGKPKGVMVTHSGIPALAGMQSERMGITPHSRVLQFASLNFDASVSEIVMAITNGAALVMLDEESRVGPALGQILARQTSLM